MQGRISWVSLTQLLDIVDTVYPQGTWSTISWASLAQILGLVDTVSTQATWPTSHIRCKFRQNRFPRPYLSIQDLLIT